MKGTEGDGEKMWLVDGQGDVSHQQSRIRIRTDSSPVPVSVRPLLPTAGRRNAVSCPTPGTGCVKVPTCRCLCTRVRAYSDVDTCL
ncbi:hypothetical protein Q5P01_006959 [Channa striata]|uniref:Uncharacterized protein n=1 Tax=Channa striata TaxID=64152 RepID=A0AA88SZA1_CHASR|nr:hypothetical protein Q5P01_006959 [Channa striata]